MTQDVETASNAGATGATVDDGAVHAESRVSKADSILFSESSTDYEYESDEGDTARVAVVRSDVPTSTSSAQTPPMRAPEKAHASDESAPAVAEQSLIETCHVPEAEPDAALGAEMTRMRPSGERVEPAAQHITFAGRHIKSAASDPQAVPAIGKSTIFQPVGLRTVGLTAEAIQDCREAVAFLTSAQLRRYINVLVGVHGAATVEDLRQLAEEDLAALGMKVFDQQRWRRAFADLESGKLELTEEVIQDALKELLGANAFQLQKQLKEEEDLPKPVVVSMSVAPPQPRIKLQLALENLEETVVLDIADRMQVADPAMEPLPLPKPMPQMMHSQLEVPDPLSLLQASIQVPVVCINPLKNDEIFQDDLLYQVRSEIGMDAAMHYRPNDDDPDTYIWPCEDEAKQEQWAEAGIVRPRPTKYKSWNPRHWEKKPVPRKAYIVVPRQGPGAKEEEEEEAEDEEEGEDEGEGGDDQERQQTEAGPDIGAALLAQDPNAAQEIGGLMPGMEPDPESMEGKVVIVRVPAQLGSALQAIAAEGCTMPLLDLYGLPLLDAGTRSLAHGLAVNTSLTKVVLSSCSIGATGARYLTDVLMSHETITWVSLSSNPIGSAGACEMARLVENGEALETLHLGACGIGNEGAAAIASALSSSSLTRLSLRRNNIKKEGMKAIGEALRDQHSLQYLSVSGNAFDGSSVRNLADALTTDVKKKECALEQLFLTDNPGMSNEGVGLISGALKRNSTLQTLVLRNVNMGPESAIALADALQSNTTLQRLDISNNKIGPEGAAAMAKAIIQSESLTEVNLWNNKITVLGEAAMRRAEYVKGSSIRLKFLY